MKRKAKVKMAQPIPAGYNVVTPYLAIQGAAQATHRAKRYLHGATRASCMDAHPNSG